MPKLRESPLTAAQRRKAKRITEEREYKGMGPLVMSEDTPEGRITTTRWKPPYGPIRKIVTKKPKKG